MRKKVLGLAVLLLASAVLVSGCGKKSGNQFVATNNATNNQNQEQNQNNNQAGGTVNPSGEYSINELLTMNQPLKCSWKESVTNGGDVTNIIYINGKKFYQDVTMGDVGHAYTISDGEYLYIWNDFSGAASKMKFTELETNTQSPQTPGTAGLDQKRDFVCENWLADNSIFIPPQDKNFQDITEEMGQAVQDLKENSEEYKQQACDLCQKAPSQELIDNCLKNMQCSQ